MLPLASKTLPSGCITVAPPGKTLPSRRIALPPTRRTLPSRRTALPQGRVTTQCAREDGERLTARESQVSSLVEFAREFAYVPAFH